MSSCSSSSSFTYSHLRIFQVTRVSLGGAGFGAAEEGQIYGGVSDDEAVACVHQAIERGIKKNGLICLLSILVGNTVRPCLYKALYEEWRLLPSLCACACLSSVLFVFGGGVLTCSA